MYYPGDQGDDWVCDCKPGKYKYIILSIFSTFCSNVCSFLIFILKKLYVFVSGYVYYPAENKCYAAFKKGPCREHEYLVLYNSTVIPVCVQNPCRHENWVRFRNSCYELGKPGPCPVPELSNVIGVNETTLEVICTKGYSYNEVLSQRLGAENNNEEPEYHNKKECFIGGIRWSSERCPQQNFDKNVASIFATS